MHRRRSIHGSEDTGLEVHLKGWHCLAFTATMQRVAGVPHPSVPDPLPAQALGGVQP